MAQTIKTKAEFVQLTDNRLIGAEPEMINSSIQFTGKGNILFCEPGVTLRNSTLVFGGSNALIYMGTADHPYMLNAVLYHHSVLAFGRKSFFNGIVNIALGERQHVVVGDGCMFSFGIWLRTSDVHLIYDCNSKQRVNPSRSIFIGDHVWVGQDAMILKGSHLGSGSIIGAKSVVTGKKIPSNSSWAGNPARQIKQGIFWEGSSVNRWSAEDTASHEVYSSDRFIYGKRLAVCPSWEEIDRRLTEEKDGALRLEYLRRILSERDKNRFAL